MYYNNNFKFNVCTLLSILVNVCTNQNTKEIYDLWMGIMTWKKINFFLIELS